MGPRIYIIIDCVCTVSLKRGRGIADLLGDTLALSVAVKCIYSSTLTEMRIGIRCMLLLPCFVRWWMASLTTILRLTNGKVPETNKRDIMNWTIRLLVLVEFQLLTRYIITKINISLLLNSMVEWAKLLDGSGEKFLVFFNGKSSGQLFGTGEFICNWKWKTRNGKSY